MNYRKQLDKWATRRAKFKAMVDRGMSPRQIAEANGLSVQRVYKILEREKRNGNEQG